jgi:hypothetical protein
LTLKVENNVWIACDFEFKAKDPNAHLQSIDLTSANNSRLLDQFAIELTLQKRRISRFNARPGMEYQINEKLLTDAAFLPKTYMIRLEKGRFCTQYDTLKLNDGRKIAPWDPRYALRLVFNVSPYPPREEWKQTDVPDVFKFWEWNEFCSRAIPKEDEGMMAVSWRWARRAVGFDVER